MVKSRDWEPLEGEKKLAFSGSSFIFSDNTMSVNFHKGVASTPVLQQAVPAVLLKWPRWLPYEQEMQYHHLLQGKVDSLLLTTRCAITAISALARQARP